MHLTKMVIPPAIGLLLAAQICACGEDEATGPTTVRVAQFNIELLDTQKLKEANNAQVAAAVEVITRHSPDVIAINELQFDMSASPGARPGAVATDSNNARLLADLLNKANPGAKPYRYTLHTLGNFGFGWSGFDVTKHAPYFFRNSPGSMTPGYINIALISRYPILSKQVKVITDLAWRDLPGNRTAQVKTDAGHEVPAGFPLLTKSLVIAPVDVGGVEVTFILLHAVRPDSNKTNPHRNFDEIRAVKLLLGGKLPGVTLAKPVGAAFRPVVMGDLNADPDHGEALPGAIAQLLTAPGFKDTFQPTGAGTFGVNPERNTTASVCSAAGGPDPAKGKGYQLDYIIPSLYLTPLGKGGMFFPDPKTHPGDWATACQASDHMMLWVDLTVRLII